MFTPHLLRWTPWSSCWTMPLPSSSCYHMVFHILHPHLAFLIHLILMFFHLFKVFFIWIFWFQYVISLVSTSHLPFWPIFTWTLWRFHVAPPIRSCPHPSSTPCAWPRRYRRGPSCALSFRCCPMVRSTWMLGDELFLDRTCLDVLLAVSKRLGSMGYFTYL